ncbi:hypothetical protein ACHAXR_000701, partial [Thalassiosira sp. AJA248-18]
MLEDCHPFPVPTRAYLKNPEAGATCALSRKRKVRKTVDEEIWRDHLAIAIFIGSDLQGLTFHHHRQAWNVVIFGAKQLILSDHAHFKHSSTNHNHMTRWWENGDHYSGHKWMRRLYHESERMEKIRVHGHDCIQHA